MLIANEAPRVFHFFEKTGSEPMVLNDPATNFSPESVKDFYASLYPALTTALIEGPEIIDDNVVYRFRPILGTKG